jgi:hypothetical protein
MEVYHGQAPDVKGWTASRVAQWVSSKGYSTSSFVSQQIDGVALMKLQLTDIDVLVVRPTSLLLTPPPCTMRWFRYRRCVRASPPPPTILSPFPYPLPFRAINPRRSSNVVLLSRGPPSLSPTIRKPHLCLQNRGTPNAPPTTPHPTHSEHVALRA